MTDFKAKMHQIRFRLGLWPRPRWGSLQCSPDLHLGGGSGLGKRKERGGEGEGGGSGGEGKGGPPSYCWTRAPQSLATPLPKNRTLDIIPHTSTYLTSKHLQLNGSVKEPNMFHNYETQKSLVKPVMWQKTCNYIKLFSSSARDYYARRRI